MPSCVVKWCINDANNHPKYTGITFHRFPKKSSRRELWIRAVRHERRDTEWAPFGNARICSVHFDDGDFYVSDRGKRLLKKDVVPVCTMVRMKREEVAVIDNRHEVFAAHGKENKVIQSCDVSVVKREPLSDTESNEKKHSEAGPPALGPTPQSGPLAVATDIGGDDATVEKILKYQIRKLEYRDKCSRQHIKRLQNKVKAQGVKIATLERLVRDLRRGNGLTEDEKTGLKAADAKPPKAAGGAPAQTSDIKIKTEPE